MALKRLFFSEELQKSPGDDPRLRYTCVALICSVRQMDYSFRTKILSFGPSSEKLLSFTLDGKGLGVSCV